MIKKVFIDPGHGGNDSGIIGIDNILEKDITLDISLKVDSLLQNQGLDVKLSRYTDTDLSLNSRVNLANSWNSDCFISLHCNSFNRGVRGVETVFANSKFEDLANCIQSQILYTKAFSINRGTKYSELFVLSNTNMSSCLIHLGFLDNCDDKNILQENQNELALGIAKGICRYLNIEYVETIEDELKIYSDTDINTSYRVICGSYDNINFAQTRVNELKKLGFKDAFISVNEI